ncbi:rCG44706 [Rattus norvegicus]|uniref:RCG44706 n=1 Tax=Rattus norvegicus TaxID=10116 RepID=A6I4M3_RAT|nr:rCG44706 [Rattus norvegicus]
MKQISMNKMIL